MECMGLFLDVGSGSFWPSDADLLVTFDSQLKIFDSLLNNHASGEHSQCYRKVRNIIAREIGEPVLKNKDHHVFDVIDTKSWEVTFLECVKDSICLEPCLQCLEDHTEWPLSSLWILYRSWSKFLLADT
ncbi:hypothetical protein Tco_1531974 [Tanacetum coccineum]